MGLDVLLEEDGTETAVESTNALLLGDLGETGDETAGEGGLGDETDTGGLKRAKGEISEELGGGGRGEVDGGAVVGSGLVAEKANGLLLEELVTTELEGTLEEVPGSGGAEASEESASTLVGNNLSEATDHTLVVGDGVQLDPSLDAVYIKLDHHTQTHTHIRTTAATAATTNNNNHHLKTEVPPSPPL